MSVVSSQTITSPANKSEECAVFTISDAREAFTFTNVATVGEEHTVSFWVKSAAAGSIVINGTNVPTTTGWARQIRTYKATSPDLVFDFGAAGTYYIYHLQLEVGNMATDWTVAVEDVDEGITDAAGAAQSAQQAADSATRRIADAESLLQVLSDSIQMLVRDENGTSLMVQEGGRWVFSMAPYTKSLSDVSKGLGDLDKKYTDTNRLANDLKTAVDELDPLKDRVIIGSYEGRPCIELSELDSDFKLRITNTQIQFVDGTVIPAYITNQKLMIEKAEIKDELQFGGFVWKKRSNGNMGLVWTGGNV